MLVFTIVHVAVLAQLTYVAWLAPLPIDPGRASDLRRLRRMYRLGIAAAGSACIGASTTTAVVVHATAPQYATGTTGTYALLFLVLGAFYARARAADVVRRHPTDPTPATGTPHSAFPTRWAIGVALPSLAAAGIAVARYARLPPTVAVHWNAAEVADQFAPTTLDGLTRFAALQAMSVVVVVGVVGYAWTSGEARDARSVHRILGTAIGGQLGLLTCSLIVCGVLPPNGVGLAAAATPLGGAVALAAVNVVRGRRRNRMPAAKTA